MYDNSTTSLSGVGNAISESGKTPGFAHGLTAVLLDRDRDEDGNFITVSVQRVGKNYQLA